MSGLQPEVTVAVKSALTCANIEIGPKASRQIPIKRRSRINRPIIRNSLVLPVIRRYVDLVLNSFTFFISVLPYLCNMLRVLDKLVHSWLSAFRPMLLILLPIGQCVAQDVEFKVDLVGVQRRNVQVIMKKHSFSEYLKDHVTYIVGPNRYQKIHYDSDTCSVVEFISTDSNDVLFEQQLGQLSEKSGISYEKSVDGSKVSFSFTDRVRPKKIYPKKNNANTALTSRSKPKVVEASDQRKAADARYFTVQKRTDEDKVDHVKVLGWQRDH